MGRMAAAEIQAIYLQFYQEVSLFTHLIPLLVFNLGPNTEVRAGTNEIYAEKNNWDLAN